MTAPNPPPDKFVRLSRPALPVVKLSAEHDADTPLASTGDWVRVARPALPVVVLPAEPTTPPAIPDPLVATPRFSPGPRLVCNLAGGSARSGGRRRPKASRSFAANSALVTAEKLRARARLAYVYVIPFEEFELDEWARTTDTFSMHLGAMASEFVYRDFRIGSALGDLDRKGQLSIGVSGGRAIFGLFDAILNQACDGAQVRIEPLVIGPIPYSAYSATSIAEIATQKFKNAKLNYFAEFGVEPGRFTITPIRRDRKELAQFNWLVMGIGAPETGSLAVHLRDLPPPPDVLARVKGDIGSNLFDKDGEPVASELCEGFVQINMDDLALLARHGSRRVVAVAGGLKKVEALTIVLRKEPRIINTLITDELTARMLIRELRPKEQSAATHPIADDEA